MEGNSLVGTVLADLFTLLSSLFGTPSDHEVLLSFSPEYQAASELLMNMCMYVCMRVHICNVGVSASNLGSCKT